MALPKPLAAFTPFLRQPGPRALLAGNAISRFGDALDTVAFGWLVYRLTGSTLMMGMLYTVNALPGLIFGLAGGLLADRRPPARTFALLCALRGALVMLIAVLALLERCPVYMLFVFTALNSTCEALGSPAAQKLPSLLLPTPALDGYLGLQQGLQTGAELLGYAVSGLVITLLGMGHTLRGSSRSSLSHALPSFCVLTSMSSRAMAAAFALSAGRGVSSAFSSSNRRRRSRAPASSMSTMSSSIPLQSSPEARAATMLPAILERYSRQAGATCLRSMSATTRPSSTICSVYCSSSTS